MITSRLRAILESYRHETQTARRPLRGNLLSVPIRILENALAEEILGRLRDKTTPPELFRQLAARLSTVLLAEAAIFLPTKEDEVETPLAITKRKQVECEVVLVPILRAGLGMLGSALELFPNAPVGFLRYRRDERTARAECYYRSLPALQDAFVFVLEPMLATGGTAVQAISDIKKESPSRIVMASVIAAPEGVDAILQAHPDVTVLTAAIDHGLDVSKFIVPGLGDFGDRLYGTR
jgi:uracil phosphoribosyltransferase